MNDSLPQPTLMLHSTLHVSLGSPVKTGRGRRVIPITGGTVAGKLTGKIRSFGADWQDVDPDGLATLDARYIIDLDDGATVEVLNTGIRRGPAPVMKALASGEAVPPSAYYMRTVARLGSEHPDHSNLSGILFLGVGARLAASVQIALYEVT